MLGGWSTTAIGRFYNGRDHSTVCYSIKRVESKRERSPEFAQLIQELTSAIHSQTGPSQQPFKSLKVGSTEPLKSLKVGSTEPRQTVDVDEGILNALAERVTELVLRRILEQLRIP
jgi:hypothetical protein